MAFTERDVISVLQKIFATADPRLSVGIGDDAAVVATKSQSIITSDMAVEDVHFKLEWSSAFDIGRKITAANVADILSMGGKCDYLTASVALTGEETLQWIENLARGMKHEADLAGHFGDGRELCRTPVPGVQLHGPRAGGRDRCHLLHGRSGVVPEGVEAR